MANTRTVEGFPLLNDHLDTLNQVDRAALDASAGLIPSEVRSLAETGEQARMRFMNGDEGAIRLKVVAGLAVTGTIVYGIMSLFGAARHTIDGIGPDLHIKVPSATDVVKSKEQVHVSAASAITKIEIPDKVSAVSAVGWTYADIVYEHWVGLKTDKNLTYTRQQATAIYGAPPLAAFTPPSNFKNNGVYEYSANPTLDEIVPGKDIHFSLGDNGPGLPDVKRYYLEVQVVDNDVEVKQSGIPMVHTNYNTQARAASVWQNPDVGSEEDVASSVAQGNFINACGPVLNTKFKPGVEVDAMRMLSSSADVLEAKGDDASIQAATWLRELDNPQTMQVSIVHEEPVTAPPPMLALPKAPPTATSIPSPAVSLPPIEMPVDNFEPPKVFVDDKETFAVANHMTGKNKNVIWDVNGTCQEDDATKQKLQDLTPGVGYFATSQPSALASLPDTTSIESQQPATSSQEALASVGSS